MISEHQFAMHYASAWRTVCPFADGFWSLENKQVDRLDAPLSAIAPKALRAVINEAAFRAFCEVRPVNHIVRPDRLAVACKAAFPAALDYVSRFSNALPFSLDDINTSCQEEAVALLARLLAYFPAQATTILRPAFQGCGLLSACEGDLIQRQCLFEVKAGDRLFRLSDLRQLLIYAALAYASNSLTFSEIGLFNPRTGVAWQRSLEDVCRLVSGRSTSDTLSALVEQFSGASASR